MKYTIGRLLALVMLAAPTPLAAQFQGTFGRSVELAGDQVLVVKPTAGRGTAAVYVYERSADGWTEVQRLGTDVTTATGEGIGPGITATGDLLLVGSADPETRTAAWAFHREDDGSWTAIDPVPMNPGAEAPATEGGPLDMAALMRILAPAQRFLATDGERVLVGAIDPRGAGSARLLERDDEGRWRLVSELMPTGGDLSGAYGVTLLLTTERAFVGAPRQDQGGGVVYVYEAGPDGWTETGRIDGQVIGNARRIGSALGLENDVLLVGAPGDGEDVGSVIMLRRGPDGTWQEVGRVSAPDAEAEQAGNDFGSAIDVAESGIWVGAPGANAVYRVEPAGTDGRWTVTGSLDDAGLDGRLGASLAAGADRLAAGAPAADGGVGRVAVYEPGSSGEWTAAVIEPAGELETLTGGAVRCAEGEAAGFSCENVDLLSFLSIDALGGHTGETMSDLWGWTDPETGAEYALAGRTAGMVVVDISRPDSPVLVGLVPASPSMARDIKTYADHAYFTGDGAPNHGLVVFDLTRLREIDPTSEPITFEPDTVYHAFEYAHNLAIDPDAGFAFVVRAGGGGETCGGGLHMVDIRDPENPTFAGCYTDTAGVIQAGSGHDTQCVVYHGPDADYQGRELCFASNESVLRIVDVTDKRNPVEISAASYPAQAYIHQGWLTEDQAYFYLDDELDEIVGNTERTRTLIWDLTDLDDPTFAGELLGPDDSTDHNLYIKGDRMYQANYQAGLRVVDVSQPTAPVEVGHFDTTPYGPNPPGFGGAWTAYPFFDSGTVIVSSITEGLFILRPVRPLVP